MDWTDPADIESTGGFPTDAARDAYRAATYGALYGEARRVVLAQQADDARRKALALSVDPDEEADEETHDLGEPVGRAA